MLSLEKSIDKNYIPEWLTAFTGFIMTLMIMLVVSTDSNKMAKQDFLSQAHKLSDHIARTVTGSMRAVYHLQSFYLGSEHVTQKEFSQYVSGFISQYPEIHAMEWVPRISHIHRSEFEQQQNIYKQGYTITEKLNDKELVAAAIREYYFPVTYIYPMQSNERAFGYDLASNSIRKNMIEQAVLTNSLAISNGIRLVQEKGNSTAVLATLPVTRPGNMAHSINDNRLLGVVLGVFRINAIINQIGEYSISNSVNISVSEYLDNGQTKQLYHKQKFSPSADSYVHTKSFNIANRKWLVKIICESHIFAAYSPINYLLIFFIGILFTLLLVAYIQLVRSSQNKAQQVNQKLTNEIAVRKQYEDRLIELNSELEVLSRQDPLMKIANRRAFDDYLMKEWKRAKRSGIALSLILADIDNFKAYNDKYGHVIGDHCLCKVANTFKSIANPGQDHTLKKYCKKTH